MPEQYKIDERVRVIVEGLVARITEGEELYPGELTIALPNPAGLYDVTVPLDSVTVERLVPAGGEPKPGEIWRDKIGRDWFAYFGRYEQVQLMSPVGNGEPWKHVNQEHGPLERVYPEAVPELVVGDVWRDQDGDEWHAVDSDGTLGLRMYGMTRPNPRTREWVTDRHGPLTLIRRNGVTVEQAPTDGAL